MPNNSLNNTIMYCVKCRTKVNITNPEKVSLKSDRKALKGTCPHCGNSTYKMISSKED